MKRYRVDERGRENVSPGMAVHFVVLSKPGALEGCTSHNGPAEMRHRCVPGLISSIEADDRVNVVLFFDNSVARSVGGPSGIDYRYDLRWGGACDPGRVHLPEECDQ